MISAMKNDPQKEDQIKEITWRIGKMVEQFETYAIEKEISKPNCIASKKILTLLINKESVNTSDILEIKQLIDWTENQDYWDGVSWMDFKLHIRTLLGLRGISIELPGI